ncbi:UDP-4-amino-4,6-dideoxy-N-acetyl-beta-L-altrosamine N-acetyltransferase [Niallia nealsonii]|uniref:UDP-4-amino-4, 6-dideoxy-N-acetyl-beta-L-altrosamine N-acetyltransferase n=1 Tax=Niallia nealsonii TaxID=115979 RepID=A0A2N0YZT7_9BACI|nr:UDP-4-amino-4,6-dideoxy-N-acetyl-beta-L-altrosamine N-acetyltransferase [Niallia nealsonii]PKG22769.1 UDP-4-amino-4,6-dideoxy-N-acetyl-beta-L-altrosamine N-acetyltransferase [Niallia nealsonii]
MNFMKMGELKDIHKEDLMQLFNWRNQESIRNMMYNSDIILFDDHVCWFEGLQKSEKAISKIFYYDNIPYGVLNINNIDRMNNKCTWGFYIGPSDAPKGMGTVLGYTSLNYIFGELSMRKLSAEVLSINEKSLNFHKKLGFTQEGILRKHVIKNGEYMDVYLYGILKEEWNDHSEVIKKMMKGR